MGDPESRAERVHGDPGLAAVEEDGGGARGDKGPRAAAQTGENYSELLFAELTDYLSPDHPFKAPGITPPEPILPPSSG